MYSTAMSRIELGENVTIWIRPSGKLDEEGRQ
jgi:hypothetical protein